LCFFADNGVGELGRRARAVSVRVDAWRHLETGQNGAAIFVLFYVFALRIAHHALGQGADRITPPLFRAGAAHGARSSCRTLFLHVAAICARARVGGSGALGVAGETYAFLITPDLRLTQNAGALKASWLVWASAVGLFSVCSGGQAATCRVLAASLTLFCLLWVAATVLVTSMAGRGRGGLCS